MLKITALPIDRWKAFKREPRQDHGDYKRRIERAQESILKATANLNNAELVARSPKAGIMRGGRLRGTSGLDLMVYGYSGGHPVCELARLLPITVEFWVDFSRYHLDFEQSPENDGHRVPHIDLYDKYHWEALQLVCFAILFGHSSLLGRVMDLLVHENDDQDAMLESLVAPYLPDRPGSSIYTRPRPYRKTKKVFDAKPEHRPALMSAYLDGWYAASRGEAYHDRHESSYFPGYWSLEAAAITHVLHIDDSSYRDKPFYPKDLVDYARSVGASRGGPSAD